MPHEEPAEAGTTLGVAEQLKMLENILQKILLKEMVTQPQQCAEASEIKSHIERLDKFFNLSKITDDEQKSAILLNTITDDMRMELCCQLDYEGNENDFEWMKKKLLSFFQPKESEITALVKLHSIRQKPQQNLRELYSYRRSE